jgi:hypothetical protein
VDWALILLATVGVAPAAAEGGERVALRDPEAPASDFGSGASPQ